MGKTKPWKPLVPRRISVEWADGRVEYLDGEDALRWWQVVGTVCRLHFQGVGRLPRDNPFELLNWKKGRRRSRRRG